MIISDSAIQFFSERTSVEMYEKRESLTVWKGDESQGVEKSGRGRGRRQNNSVENSQRNQEKVSLAHQGGMKSREISQADMEVSDDDLMNIDLNMRVLASIFERITGRKFQMTAPVATEATPSEVSVETDAGGSQPVEEIAATPVQENEGVGFSYQYHESRYEYEKTEFQSQGIIKTGDGVEIDFNVSMSMSREFYSEQNINVNAGAALKDPLVVNFSGAAAEVTQRDFNFDIDADGQKDQIGFVGPGSGFLALDKNKDGTINDGRELFGALSGDGFADLATYDDDGNNWIDENDAIYENLRIWSRNEDGEEQLMGLGEAGVGAFYLQHIETLFSVKNTENELLGQVKETGLAVMETGQVVTMQQLDLVA